MFIIDAENNLINTNHIIKIYTKSQTVYDVTTYYIFAELTKRDSMLHKCDSKNEHEKAFSDLCNKLGVII